MADPTTASPDNQSFKDQRDILREINAELGKQINNVKDASKAYSGLEGIAKKLQNDEEAISKLSAKQLKDLKTKAEINLRDLKSAAEKLTYENASTEAEIALLIAKQENFAIEQELLNSIKKRLDQEININKSLGISGNLLKGMSGLLNKLGLGALNNVINFEEINEKLREQAEQLTNNGEKVLGIGGKLKIAANAARLFGGELLKALSDPVVLGGLLVTGFKKLVELGFKADSQVTNLSKSMAISKDQASALRDRFVEIQNSGKSLFETTENLVKAQLELADAFGATQGFTEQQVRDQVLLTKQIGLSADEAAGLQQLAMANGKTAKEVNSSIIKQTASLARQTGIQLDNKKILGEVAKVSGQIRLQYQNNPELIAKAVVQTQKLGITLDQAAQMSKKLLNFEESISDQISAELLTGKELNLERARLLALNGDIAGASAEILSQVGSAAEFSAMNVIQQEALAKAVGMTANELADSLVKQENLNKLGSETKKQIQAQAEELRKKGMIDEANRLMNSIGNEKEAQDALTRISAQEKFNVAVEKLQAMLGSIVEGPMGKMLDKLVAFLADTERLKNLFETIKITAGIIATIIGVRMVAGLVSSIAKAAILLGLQTSTAAAATATNAAVTFGAGTVAVIASVAAILGALGAATLLKDGEVNSDGLVVGKYNKGVIQPIAQGAPDDNVIFTTNKPKTNPGGTGVTIDISPLAYKLDQVASILDKIYHKEGNVYQDTVKVGTSTNMGTYKVQ